MSTAAAQTYDLTLLHGSHAKWQRSAGLRALYGSLYVQMGRYMRAGASLELGSGIGAIRSFLPGVVTSDIVQTPYVDCACSAYEIERCRPPGTDAGDGDRVPLWQNILALDVLHHLCRPMDFFASAASALAAGGRIILMEPAATPLGIAFYRMCHPEPIIPAVIQPPFVFAADPQTGEFANMAMARGLFAQQRPAVDALLAGLGLRVQHVIYRDLLAYPLTGGYSGRQMVPTALLRGLIRMESCLPQGVLRQTALRMLVVLEKPGAE